MTQHTYAVLLITGVITGMVMGALYAVYMAARTVSEPLHRVISRKRCLNRMSDRLTMQHLAPYYRALDAYRQDRAVREAQFKRCAEQLARLQRADLK